MGKMGQKQGLQFLRNVGIQAYETRWRHILKHSNFAQAITFDLDPKEDSSKHYSSATLLLEQPLYDIATNAF